MRTLRLHGRCFQEGSTLVIVLWIAIGLVSLTLYFGQSVLFEVRASDHRIEGISSEQATEAGARYVMAVLANRLTNGVMPDAGDYLKIGVPLQQPQTRTTGESPARFWLIGRVTNDLVSARTVEFGLVDEASKINLNTARSNILFNLANYDQVFTDAILDWRSSNGPGTSLSYYGMQMPSYECKQSPFETVDEARLVVGASEDILVGEDWNRNGILDASEEDLNRDGLATPGLLDYFTIYSREPNTYSNGTAKVNIRALTSATANFTELLQNNLSAGTANNVMQRLGLSGGGGGGPGGGQGGGGAAVTSFNSPLQLFRRSGMTSEEFALIADKITVAEGDFIEGRININTAPARVLSCLPGLDESPDLVQAIINYRAANQDRLTSVAWLVDAIGQNNEEILARLEGQDSLTTESYQFTADVAAVGAYGRGYRRVRYVIDTALGTPRIVYRQDLTALGWALGEETRQQLREMNNGQPGNY